MSLKSKRGSATVFLVMVSVSIIGMILIFIQVSKERALCSCVTSLGNLWSESVIGEYDIDLKEKYALFGFRTSADDVNFKVRKMADYSFSEKKYIESYSVDCNLYEYSLALPSVLKKQIVTAGQMNRLSKEDKESINEGVPRIILNDVILNALPSRETDVSKTAFNFTELVKNLNSLNEVVKDGGERYFINNYINCYFKDSLNDKNLEESYFKNEVEYIICGKTSDEKNEDAIRNRIVAMREILNLKYLTLDPEKNSALTAAAELLTPGPQAVLTKQALKASWALAESINDYRLLKSGKCVEFFKSDLSWATDLDSIINNTGSGYIDTGFDGGNDYGDYLNFFTWVMSEELLLLRIMDIVQINMCYLYDDSFLMKDTNGGVCINMKVNGRYYEFTEDYFG